MVRFDELGKGKTCKAITFNRIKALYIHTIYNINKYMHSYIPKMFIDSNINLCFG